MTKSAAVVGGGISGLAVAGGLSRLGWDVTVLERSHGPAESGTVLGMWPEAMAALDRLQVGDAVRARSQRHAGAQIMRPDGRTLAALGDAQEAHLIARPDLLAALHATVDPAIIRWGHTVGELPDADLVIGADGVNSVVRAAAWPGAEPRSLGTVAFRGTVAGEPPDVIETWGPGQLFGMTPKPGGATNWFAALRADLAPAEADPHELLRARYGTWHPAVRRVLDGLEDIDRRALTDLPRFGSFVAGNRVLLGDAAHAMAPNLGRGACESLIDAAELVDALQQEPTLDGALHRYDRARRTATHRIVRASRLANRLSTARRGLRSRNALVRIAGRFA